MKTHRGLSSVIGTVFLIAIVIGAMSYIASSLEIMGNFSEQLIAEESRLKDQREEAYEISSIDITVANKLDGIIKNTGEIPVQLKTLYIDEQGVNDVVQKIPLDEAISPGNTVNIIDLADYTIDPTKGYNMKVVSSRGEVYSFYVNSPSQENLQMYIRAVPEYIPSEFTTTVLYSVVNNMSNNNVLYNVTPELTITDVIGVDVNTLRSGPIPTSYPVLAPGDVAVFEYSIQLTGDLDNSSLFNATIANAMVGNSVTTSAIIREVTVATQAGTSLEAGGLVEEDAGALDILYFHDETDLTPGTEYEMDGGDPAGGGTTLNPRDGDITFLSAPAVSEITIVNGTWNVRLSYWSDLTPQAIPEPDIAFHFTCNNCPDGDDTSESSGTINDDDLDKSGSVTHFSTGGPDGGAYYAFSGSDDYLKTDHHLHNYDEWELDGKSLTTSTWFRIPATTDNYMPIIRWGAEWDSGSDEYEITLGDGGSGSHGSIVYRYTTDIDGDETKCETDGSVDYDDGLWHHAVATRDGDDDCKLYVDGSLADDVEECNGCGGSSSVDVADDHRDEFYVGYDGNGQEIDGDVSSFLHWENTELTANQIEELYYTGFGNNGTRLTVSMYVADVNGATLSTINSTTYPLPFHDPAAKSWFTDNNRWDVLSNNNEPYKHSFSNATFTTTANVTLAATQTIKTVLSWPGDSQNLQMNLRFDDDDNDYSLPEDPSFIQTPNAIPGLPSFVTIDQDDQLEYTVINSGPEGAWFTSSGTRFVITLPDGSASYGGIIDTINGTAVSSIQDSIFIADQQSAVLRFEILSNPPQLNAPSQYRAPPGLYNAAVFLSGFDDQGETFLRTIVIGSVNVVE